MTEHTGIERRAPLACRRCPILLRASQQGTGGSDRLGSLLGSQQGAWRQAEIGFLQGCKSSIFLRADNHSLLVLITRPYHSVQNLTFIE